MAFKDRHPVIWSNLSVIIVLGLIFIVLFGTQIARMPETNARVNAGHARQIMRDWKQKLEDTKKTTGAYPPARPFPKISWKNNEQETLSKDFGTLPGDDTPLDPCNRKLPFVYQTDGQEYVMLSSGPGKLYSLSPAKFLKHEYGAAALADNTYDPTNGSFSSGDIYSTSTLLTGQ